MTTFLTILCLLAIGVIAFFYYYVEQLRNRIKTSNKNVYLYTNSKKEEYLAWVFRATSADQYLYLIRKDSLEKLPELKPYAKSITPNISGDTEFDNLIAVECYNPFLIHLLQNKQDFRESLKKIFENSSVKSLFLNQNDMAAAWIGDGVQNAFEHMEVLNNFESTINEYIVELPKYSSAVRLRLSSVFLALGLPFVFFLLTVLFSPYTYSPVYTLIDGNVPRWHYWLGAIVPTGIVLSLFLSICKIKIIRTLVRNVYIGLIFVCCIQWAPIYLAPIDIFLGSDKNTIDVSADIVKLNKEKQDERGRYLVLPSITVVTLETDGFNHIETGNPNVTKDLFPEAEEKTIALSPFQYKRWYKSFSTIEKGCHVNGELTIKKGISGNYYLVDLQTTQDLDRKEGINNICTKHQ